MSKVHNKKRNVGIVYEQLVSTVSRFLVEGNQDDANKALKIVKKYFAPGTELYKEFRLFNALIQTCVKSDALASRILEDTKHAVNHHDATKLRVEKSHLINEINRTFNKDTFYNTPVKNYKLFATIHTLIEEWRSDYPDVMRRAMYESKLHEWLMTAKETTPIESMKTPDVSSLTVRIMRESFNKKFGDTLNLNQRELLQSIAFAGDADKVRVIMKEHQAAALNSLKKYQSQCDNRIVEQKIPNAVKILESLDTEDTSDKNVARFMTVSRLCDELMENNNG